MAVVRENILNNINVRDQFLEGVRALDDEGSGLTTVDLFNFLRRNNLPLSMRGLRQPVSIYDLFVFWHIVAMSIQFPVGNAAHGGPIFLPWHRMYLIRFEEALQRILQDPSFGLPYWDWAEDGELRETEQWRATLWTPDYLGESRGDLRSGVLSEMRVRLVGGAESGVLASVRPRPITRAAGMDSRWPNLPTQRHVEIASAENSYDQAPWNSQARGFRNLLEGWPSGPQLHNRVHTWIGGDMGPGTSPNDPVFFLNHCFVDRIWERWMAFNGREYEPKVAQGPQGHRIDTEMVALLGEALTPAEVLDPQQWYNYDNRLVV